MKVTFNIADDLHDKYEARAAVEADGKVNLLLKEVLERFVDAPPSSDRPIMLDAEARRALEAVADTTVDSAAEVVALVRRLSTMQLGEFEYHFTVDQLVRLEEQAESYGIELQEYLELAMERFWDWRANLA